MIDLIREKPLTFSQAARLIPSGMGDSGPAHVSTIYRWAQKGQDGVRLEAVRLGGRWVTSAEAIQRFVEAVTEAYAPALAPRVADVAREEAEARRILAAAGF
jgi:hypothetical protein